MSKTTSPKFPRVIIAATNAGEATIIRYQSVKQVEAALDAVSGNVDMFDVKSEEQLAEVPNAVLLSVFNQLQSKADATWQAIPRFRDRATGLRRTTEVLVKAFAGEASESPSPAPITPKQETSKMSETQTLDEQEQEQAPAVDVEAVKAQIADLEAKLEEASATYKQYVADTKGTIAELRASIKGARKSKPAGERQPRATGPSETVQSILALLQRPEGATKSQIKEAVPEAKEGYIGALLTRVLKEKGYAVESRAVEGSRERAYYIAA